MRKERETVMWHRATCSDAACVEVQLAPFAVHVRSSEAPRDVLTFTIPEWDAFIAGVKLGEFEITSPGRQTGEAEPASST